MEDLLKDISDGQSLLGIIAFYHPSVITLEGKYLVTVKTYQTLSICAMQEKLFL